MFYAKSTGGFYSTEIHGNSIPDDAVEVSDDEYCSLMNGQQNGKQISSGLDGQPVLVDPPPASPDIIWQSIKRERDCRTESGGYKVGANWFHSDQKSRSQQLGLVLIGAAIAPNLQWKTMAGTFVHMTQQLAADVLAAAAASDQAIFAAAEQHRIAMEAASDPSAYDFSQGWPKTYAEETAQ